MFSESRYLPFWGEIFYCIVRVFCVFSTVRILDSQKVEDSQKLWILLGLDTVRFLCITSKSYHKEVLSFFCEGVTVQTGEHSSVQDAQAAVRLYTMFRLMRIF
jgi:hypothetical protein